MVLRCTKRNKDGKEHRYWNVVENRRVTGGRVVQRQVLYLGEINDSQRQAWRKTIEVFEDGAVSPRTMALFPENRSVEIPVAYRRAPRALRSADHRTDAANAWDAPVGYRDKSGPDREK